ncbi:MAG: LysR family transcriptional regulator [Holosporales bacterium]|jgi:DNA-binding transcriptional LysR family regulator|nr:LysR family transcriptional regulator [Holosporales bacterium]
MKDFDWQILTELYNTRSITKTAERLFTSQPNITKRLKCMESELGVQIVLRSQKGITFTHQGEYLVERAAEILRLIKDTKEKIHEIANISAGTLKLGAPNSFVRNELPSILQHYRERPQITFQLITRLSDDIPALVESGDIDVGFAHGDIDGVIVKHRYTSELLNIVSHNNITVDELPNLTQIDFTRSRSTQNLIKTWWQWRFGVPRNVALKVNTGDICLEIVREGIGFGLFFGTSYFNRYDELNSTLAIDRNGIPVKRDTWILYTKRGSKIAVVRDFVNFVVNEHLKA